MRYLRHAVGDSQNEDELPLSELVASHRPQAGRAFIFKQIKALEFYHSIPVSMWWCVYNIFHVTN